MRIVSYAAAALLLAPAFGRGEDACPSPTSVIVDGLGTPAADTMRTAELAGAAPLSPRLIQRGGLHAERLCEPAAMPAAPFLHADTGAALRAVPLRLTTTWNSRYPSGDNDGLLWAGRGVSQLLSGGAAFRRGPFSAALAPELTWSENRWFDILPNGRTGDLRFGNPYYGDGIDLPQRFGAGPFAAWGFGQSYLRVDHWNVAAGLSSESLWIGPGIRNSILMSNAGPGFPHVFLGTSRPADIWIGKAEALLYYGRLERTRYILGGGHPLISGLALTYEPRWIPGLYVGLHRYFVQPWDGLTLRDYLAVFQAFSKKSLQSSSSATEPGDNPRDNQIVSLFARWVFPEAGLEIYGEWAREDHAWSLWTLSRDPDRSAAYLVGLQKVFRAGSKLVRFQAEATDLQEMAGFRSVHGLPVYYIHGNDLDLTNRGQLLGAWIGPGGDSQTVAVDVFHAGGRIGGYLERVRREDAYYWEVIEPADTASHDVELAFGARQAFAAGPLEIAWDAGAGYRQNRDFLRNEWNLRLQLWLTMPFR